MCICTMMCTCRIKLISLTRIPCSIFTIFAHIILILIILCFMPLAYCLVTSLSFYFIRYCVVLRLVLCIIILLCYLFIFIGLAIFPTEYKLVR